MAIARRKLLMGGAALWVAPSIVRAQTSSKVHVGHGFAMHGEPRYPEPPQSLEFVNPNAPKGGNVRFGSFADMPSPGRRVPPARASRPPRLMITDEASRPSRTWMGLVGIPRLWPRLSCRSW